MRIYRRLDKKRREEYRTDLVAGLNNLASLLRRHGRIKEALKISRESVSLVDAGPPGLLAQALLNLGNLLGDLGAQEEALQTFQQSVALLCQTISTDRKPASLPNLATVLNNLALALFAVGRSTESLESLTAAVAFWRDLMPDQREVALPGRAMTCLNQGVILAQTGFLGEAETAARRAVELYQELDQEQPGLFSNDLAMSLEICSRSSICL